MAKIRRRSHVGDTIRDHKPPARWLRETQTPEGWLRPLRPRTRRRGFACLLVATIARVAAEGNELRNDQLSPYARTQHRNLLITASVSVLFLIFDPNQISAFGVTIENSERRWLLFILFVTILYFKFAFLTASRADYHVWKRGLSLQRDHLAALEDRTSFELANESLDENLADGENPAEITRRREELRKTRDAQLATREHLVPIVRSLSLRGWIDFWLAPIYGATIAFVLLYQLLHSFC
jgi:hypothetical protein